MKEIVLYMLWIVMIFERWHVEEASATTYSGKNCLKLLFFFQLFDMLLDDTDDRDGGSMFSLLICLIYSE